MSGIGGVIGGIGSALGSIINAQQQRKAQEQAADDATALSQQAADIARQQMSLAWDRWNTYKRDVAPLEQAQAQEAMDDLELLRPLKQARVSQAMEDLDLTSQLREDAANRQLGLMNQLDPIRDAFLDDALAGVGADPAMAEGRAATDVHAAFAKSRAAEERRRRGLGLDPYREQYLDLPSRLAETAAEAAERTRAAQNAVESARLGTNNLRLAALGLTRFMPSVPASSAGTGLGLTTSYSALGNPSGDTFGLMRSAQSGLTSLAAMQRRTTSGSVLGDTLGSLNGIIGAVGNNGAFTSDSSSDLSFLDY